MTGRTESMEPAMKRTWGAVVIAVLLGLAASPATACQRVASVDGIDQALARARLSSSQASRVRELRDRVADQVARGDYRAAEANETKAMALMGLKFEDYGQVVRGGGCNGRWVPRRG